ncbi:hypothetical protein RhiirC2_801427 [Rhizophagus irregularis]|uniref:Uncharacterized protein n=1 Tax=Rhizophagus irregularis TaxID=588596 RepID=A0A2N1M2H9_9GLOM|nr:hypothetical protein RhiirC2_801427 [Rhizophagus irregularis]
MRLRAKNKELKQKLEMANKELLDLQALNQLIIAINEEFGRENDKLYKKVGQYETLQKPLKIDFDSISSEDDDGAKNNKTNNLRGKEVDLKNFT